MIATCEKPYTGQGIVIVGRESLACWFRTTDRGERVFSFDAIDYWPSKAAALEYAQQTCKPGADFLGDVIGRLPGLPTARR